MAKFAFVKLSANSDPWGIGPKVQGPKLVVEADAYRIDPGFVTFLRGGEPFVSVPHSKVGVVETLGDDDSSPIQMLED